MFYQVKHIQGDRKDFEGLKEKLKGTGFNVVYDINGEHFFSAAATVCTCKNTLPACLKFVQFNL